jgi:hypothetical protein
VVSVEATLVQGEPREMRIAAKRKLTAGVTVQGYPPFSPRREIAVVVSLGSAARAC